MTKTPEELTEEWYSKKLQTGSFWFVETKDGYPELFNCCCFNYNCETDDGEQRLLSHEQYNDLMKARKSKGKKNETR